MLISRDTKKEVLRTPVSVFFTPLLAHCCGRSLDVVFEIVVNCSIVITDCSGEPDQIFMVGMQDDCRRIAITSNDCGMMRNILQSS